jgi:hypothetical protein
MGSFTLLDEVWYGSFPIANFLRRGHRSRRPEADAKNRTEKFPRTTEISRFFEIFGYLKFPIRNDTVSVARRAKFGRAQRVSRCRHTRAVRHRRSRDRSASFDTIRISVGRRDPELRIAENDASARIWSVSLCGAHADGTPKAS